MTLRWHVVLQSAYSTPVLQKTSTARVTPTEDRPSAEEPFISFTQPQGDEIHVLWPFKATRHSTLKGHIRNILWWVERRNNSPGSWADEHPWIWCVYVCSVGFMLDFSAVEIQWMEISQLADQKEQMYLMKVLIISSDSICFMQVRLKVHFQHYTITKNKGSLLVLMVPWRTFNIHRTVAL